MVDDRGIEALLEEVMDSGRSPEDVCRASPELLPAVRDGLRRLRAFEGEVAAMFPTHSPGGLDGTQATEVPDVPGYVVLELLGRGGIGVVYRARDVTLDRDVAVKLLQDKHSCDSPVGRRFADEARITARLQHPGIPPVHELGTLPNGRPFLAMKLINGSTLDQLLAARSNFSDGRGRFVAAFEQVCQAVGYAHAHNVIHRDLKPSNVMVGAFGEVQVMDWGLAKFLTERGDASRAPDSALDVAAITEIQLAKDVHQQTNPRDVLGTPAFMPPEQAIGAVDRIDARSDVYSLGGILCAVLTGKPPYVAHSSEATRRLAAQARLEDARARLAACEAEPELVALCLRCLSPGPDHRPRDAGEVAAAVAALRVAAEERARRAELDSVRVAEQSKRRRMFKAASAAIVVVLLAALMVSLWQTRRTVRALEAEHVARQAEGRARQQAFAALRSMTDEVVERKFAAGQGYRLTEEDRAYLKAIQLQWEAFAAIQGDDADDRAVRAEGRFRVGMLRYELGEVREAEQDYDTALTIQKQLVAEFPTNPEFRRDLAKSHNNRGVLLRVTGRMQEAEADLSAALAIRKQLAAEFPIRPELRQDLATSHTYMGVLLMTTDRRDDAEMEYAVALGIQNQLVADFPTRPEFRRELARTHGHRGELLRTTGRREQAEPDYIAALAIQQQLASEFPPRPEFRLELAGTYGNRGELLRALGRLQEAERDYDAALAIHSQLAADFPTRPEFRVDLAGSHNNRGILLEITGRLNEAEADYNQALAIGKQLVADFPNQPDLQNGVAATCVNLALLHRLQRDAAGAKRWLLEGRPYHLAALAANPRNPTYRQFYRNNLSVLTGVHASLLDRDEAMRTAETRRDLGWDPPGDTFDAACFLSLCVPLVADHENLDATQRDEAAKFYSEAAMRLLRNALSKGFDDVAQVTTNTALEPLWKRDDFQELVKDLEGQGH